MKTIKEIEEQLKAPFPAESIDWRISRSGTSASGKPWAFCLAYIDARAAMDRLDEVVGIENWSDSYNKVGNATLCTLSLKIDGQWVSKTDGAEDTDYEPVKGGISGAFKRACSRWGIGRYLYGLTETFAEIVEKNTKDARSCKIDNKYQYWLPPELPAWALPKSVETVPAKKVKEDKEIVSKVVKTFKAIGVSKIKLESFTGKKINDLDNVEIDTLKDIYNRHLSKEINANDYIDSFIMNKEKDVK